MLGQAAPQAKTRQTIFIFHSGEFWLNLHHFLYVLGRAENKTRDSSRSAVVNAPKDQEQGLAKLTPAEQAIWREAGGIAQFKTPLEEVWKPYLEGRGTRDEALAELVKRTAE
jgi:hypothetical protein